MRATINFVGDVALFKESERREMDPFDLIELPDSDYNVANLEFPLSKKCIKNFYDVSSEYIVEYDYAKNINFSKFDLYGLANNHILDYGFEGIEATCDLIDESGSSYFGLSKSKEFNVYQKQINDVNFAFIAAVKNGRWNNGFGNIGPCIIYKKELETTVTKLFSNKIFDHIIIYLHWGTELVDAPIPEDVEFARSLIDGGASCVIGHHPHVIQGLEEYNKGLIAYSLGSFIYLSEFEKGNYDKAKIRDMSMCLNIRFDKNSIATYRAFKYIRNTNQITPELSSTFKNSPYFIRICEAIGDSKYYSSKVRTFLLKRELLSFVVRFKENPIRTINHYFSYIKFDHLRKVLGFANEKEN